MPSPPEWKQLICFFPCCVSVSLSLSLSLCAAPSAVTVIKKDRTSRNSISLSWMEPERPNGIILDYEVKYYEKVGSIYFLFTVGIHCINIFIWSHYIVLLFGNIRNLGPECTSIYLGAFHVISRCGLIWLLEMKWILSAFFLQCSLHFCFHLAKPISIGQSLPPH